MTAAEEFHPKNPPGFQKGREKTGGRVASGARMVSVMLPAEILAKLPADRKARRADIIAALRAYYFP